MYNGKAFLQNLFVKTFSTMILKLQRCEWNSQGSYEMGSQIKMDVRLRYPLNGDLIEFANGTRMKEI